MKSENINIFQTNRMAVANLTKKGHLKTPATCAFHLYIY